MREELDEGGVARRMSEPAALSRSPNININVSNRGEGAEREITLTGKPREIVRCL